MNNEQNNLLLVLFANNDIIRDTLLNNYQFPTELKLIKRDWGKFLDSSDKIDLLIISDIELRKLVIPEHKIRVIVNVLDTKISDKEIKMKKPIIFIELLTIIRSVIESSKIFISLKNNWIYNEADSMILNASTVIKLTTKENEIIRYLVNCRDNTTLKTKIFDDIWCYNANSESSTLDTHLYTLKQKLPDNMFKMDSLACQLIL